LWAWVVAGGSGQRATFVGVFAPHRSQGDAFHQAQASAVEYLTHEPEGRFELVEQGEDLAAREHGRQMHGPSRGLETGEIGHGHVEDAFVQEDDGAEGLVLRRRGHAALRREFVEECGDLACAHRAGMLLVVKADELADPVEVRFLESCRRRSVVCAASRRVMGSFRGGRGSSPSIDAWREELRVRDARLGWS